MKDFNFINLNDFTWQLNVAIMGGIFAVFSIIYNTSYIHYGLITFAFGIIAHTAYIFFEWIFRKRGTDSKWYWLAHLSNGIFVITWISVLVYLAQ